MSVSIHTSTRENVLDARHGTQLTALGMPPLASPADPAEVVPVPVVELLDMVVGVVMLLDEVEVVIIMVDEEEADPPDIPPDEEMLNC